MDIDPTRPLFWNGPKTTSLRVLSHVLPVSLHVCRTVTKHRLPWETFWESISKLQFQELPLIWKHAEILQFSFEKFKTYAWEPPSFSSTAGNSQNGLKALNGGKKTVYFLPAAALTNVFDVFFKYSAKTIPDENFRVFLSR